MTDKPRREVDNQRLPERRVLASGMIYPENHSKEWFEFDNGGYAEGFDAPLEILHDGPYQLILESGPDPVAAIEARIAELEKVYYGEDDIHEAEVYSGLNELRYALAAVKGA